MMAAELGHGVMLIRDRPGFGLERAGVSGASDTYRSD